MRSPTLFASNDFVEILCSIFSNLTNLEQLGLVENNLSSNYDIAKLLQNDTGRLRKRVDATIKVNREEMNAIAWGTLIVASQKGRKRAMSWLNKQPSTSKQAKEKIEKLLDQIS